MKWNIEWIDLQNIERMIAECWRMNDRQLERYYRKLSNRRDLEFAGGLGNAFLELMYGIINGKADYSWSELQKDVHMLQKLIQDGLDRDEEFWNEQYQDLVDEPSFYFYTDLGTAFISQLAVKLEINITKEQKLLQQDIQLIEKICEICDFKKESDVQKALAILKQKEKNYFSSWLGEGFLTIVQEQFVKKEPEPVPPILPEEPQPEPEPKRLFSRKSGSDKRRRSVKSLLFCIPIAFAGIWLCVYAGNGQLHLYLRQLGITVKALTAEPAVEADKRNAADTAQHLDQVGRADGSSVSEEVGASDQDVLHSADQEVRQNGMQDTDLNSVNGQGHVPDHAVEVEEQNSAPVTGTDMQQKDAGQAVSAAGRKAADTADGATESGQKSAAVLPDILPQYQAFYSQYPDLFGWLKIPGTEIDVPVMQSDDEERGEKYYYLHRDYAGRASAEGSLFVDSSSSIYPQDQNTVIYGHNMSSGHIFGTLDRFEDIGFLKEHQDLQYDTIYETGTYRIAAVLKTRILYQDEVGFRYYRFFHYDTVEEFQECVDFIKQNQLFDTGEELQYGDQLLMLSTCEYSQENGRLVIVAKRVAGDKLSFLQ